MHGKRGRRAVVTVGIAIAFAMLAGQAPAVDEPVGDEVVLRKQVADLVEALAAARSEIDSLKAGLDALRLGAKQAVSLSPVRRNAVWASELRLLDANEELRMVVLNAGASLGMRPGMRFAVTRAGKVVGEIQIIDVREKIAGAAVIKANRGVFPSVADGLMDILPPQR
jgi:hypothetical protein